MEVNTSLDAACKAEKIKLEKERDRLSAAINEFNNSVLDAVDSFGVTAEEKKMNEDFDVWLHEKQEKVQSEVLADNWTKEVLMSLEQKRPCEPTFRPKDFADLHTGDILLMVPSSVTEKMISLSDKIYNSYNTNDQRKASHAILFLGRNGPGRGLFFNNTSIMELENGGGPRTISENQYISMYGERDYYVARPLDKVNGRLLMETANKMGIESSKNISLLGTPYGILGKDMVCSETADFIVAKATGRIENTKNKNRIIEVTPNNFFDEKDVGRYYCISHVIKKNEK